MEYWSSKKRNLKIPKLGLGTYQIYGENCISIVSHAIRLGLRHIDTAQIYENESEVGEAIKNSKIPRENFFLTTKIWRDFLDPKGMLETTKVSLEKLKTNYVDLLLIHWPNEKFSLKESLETLKELQNQKKTRFIGVSNFPSELLKKALNLEPELLSNQVEYHPLLSQKKIQEIIDTEDMFLTAYSPLARGKIFEIKQIQEIAKKHKKEVAHISLRFLLDQKNVIPIFKSKDLKRIESNINIFDFQLEKEDRQKLYNLSNCNLRVINPPFSPSWDN